MKLSVVMITYNHERFIGEALESALRQRVNFDYEIVVGDDCSTDSTREIIVDFCHRFPGRIKPLFRNRNLGAHRNFAETISQCTGEYVAFLEGDDYWTSGDKLQKQADVLDAHPAVALCCHRIRLLDETGTAACQIVPSDGGRRYGIDDLLRRNFVGTCSVVLRRKLIPSLPDWLFEMKMGDWPLWVLVARHGEIYLMDECMATYRLHADGAWTSLPQSTRLEEIARMLRALDKELEFQHSRVIAESIAQLYLDLALDARSRGQRIEAARHLVTWLGNNGPRLPVNPRLPGGLLVYVLIGSGYKIFSRANDTTHE